MTPYRLISLACISVLAAFCQAPPATFEVISVKPSIPGTLGGRMQFLPGGRFYASNVPLTGIIQNLFRVRSFQIAGDPKLLSVIADGHSARYDIQAKGDASATEAQVRDMAKALLAERFHLKVHKENRDLPVYALSPAPRTGIKLAPAPESPRIPGSGGVAFMLKGWIQGSNVSMETLVRTLSELVDRPVVDKTLFTDAFSFRLTFTPDLEPGQEVAEGGCPASFAAFQEQRRMKVEPMDCPSIFSALQEQLGLKLDSRREPVEVLVIDHVEPPTAN
ncbi:MAG: peptidase BlaR1 [Bryobacterales bacterium]|jgi:uncharacterized protein (TIGR03435 family)|nr:peptidase BlaR1 [Bryobacterales bacterium]